MPEFDFNTAAYFSAGTVLFALGLCVGFRFHRKNDPAMSWLIASNLALLSAAMGIFLGPLLDFTLASILAIGGAYAGICFGYLAIVRAEDKPMPWRPLAICGAVGIAAQAVIADATESVGPLVVSSSIINAVLTGIIVVSVWRMAHCYGQGIAMLLCVPFATLLVGYLGRLLLIAATDDVQAPLLATIVILIAMAWAAVILELGMATLREVQAQRDLRRALSDLQATSAARTRFLLALSHELRTPLNGIVGMAELMRVAAGPDIDTRYAQNVEIIRQNGVQLSRLIEHLLDHTAGPCASAEEIDRLSDAIRSHFAEQTPDTPEVACRGLPSPPRSGKTWA